MSVGFGSNIASLKAQRKLAEGTSALSKTFERLSSGQRINRASDDAAGLAISSALTTSRRVYIQGIRNLNDGISMLNIADSSVESLSAIVVRLQELATQAANGPFGVRQRKSIDDEAQALSKEYFRIARSTNFNNLSLFDGSLNQLRLQSGYGVSGSISSGLGGAIGDGTFRSGTSYAVAVGEVYDVTMGDLNGDGIQDLVTCGYASSTGYAMVQLGTGGGSFGAATSYVMNSSNSTDVELGDVNGDGLLDLVTAGYGAGGAGASVRLGRGDGTFQALVSFESGPATIVGKGLALGDLNGDGILDVVTGGYDAGLNGFINVRIGQGNGTFGAVTSFQSLSSGISVRLGDFNGDGLLDLASAGDSFTAGVLSVRLGNGNGTFKGATSYAGGTSNSELAIGDLNNDGIFDITLTGFSVSGHRELLTRLGRSDGTFGSTITTTLGDFGVGLSHIAFGDVNGDGLLDVATHGYSTTTISLGTGRGTFEAATTFAAGGSFLGAVFMGDATGDGVVDVLSGGQDSGGIVNQFVSNTKDGVSPLLPFDLKTRAGALQALPILQKKLESLASQRGSIGAFQSRISVASRTMEAASENFAAAASRIRDTDLAADSANLVRLNILQQAGSAVLAQANMQPAIALNLLDD